MHCPACQAENRDDVSFCAACGESLPRRCAACGRALRAGARFCDGCGRRVENATPAPAEPAPPTGYTPRHVAEVLASRSAREGERKQVTVLFVDVKGSVGLSAQLDSEDWHDVMERFFHVAGEAVHRFGGTLNQFTGDGVMALFGAPVAYEDHAHRAGLAALALRDGLAALRAELARERGLDLAVRTGLHSGEAVVGSIGSDLRRDYTAQGYTVGIAARLQALAPPGEIALSEQTARLARGFFELRALGPFELAGARAPVRVFQLLGPAKTRARSEGSPPASAGLAGRGGELARLEDALASACAGAGRTVGLVGEAGFGKSRLAAELLARCRGQGIAVYETRCAAHGEGRPYGPIVELVRAALHIADDATPEASRAQVAERLAAIDPELTASIPLALDFLELADAAQPAVHLDPAARQRLLLALLQAIVDDAHAAAPAVVAVEDVQGIDAASGELLARLVEAAESRPLFVLVTFRPGFRAPWMTRASYEQIVLAPLAVPAAHALIGGLLGPDASARPLVEWIAERSAGNPLFLEETIATLAAEGVLVGKPGAYRQARDPSGVEIPPTVQALLAARVDRLSDAEKRVLQAASVIGEQVTAELAASVLELDAAGIASALESLHRSEVLAVQTLYPAPRYGFRHPLIREVTYRSQLREQRVLLHGAVARQLARAQGRLTTAHSEAVAYHYEQAGELLEAARWLRRFCGWVGARDLRGALGAARRARDLLGRVLETPEVLGLRLGAHRMVMAFGYQAGLSPVEIEATVRDSHALAERGAPGAERELALLYSSYGQAYLHGGDVPEAVRATERALAFAKDAGDAELEHSLLSFVVFLLRALGRYAEALAFAAPALELARERPGWGRRWVGHDVGTLLLHRWGALLCDTGRVAEGLDAMERAATLARDSGELQILCWQLHDRIWLAELAGPREGLVALAQEALVIAEQRGSESMRVQAFSASGAAQHLAGAPSEAALAFERALAISAEHAAARIYDPQSLAGLAEARLALGDRDAAEAALARGLASAERLGAAPQELRVQVARARLSLASGASGRTDAAAALDRADSLVAATGAALWRPLLGELRAAAS